MEEFTLEEISIEIFSNIPIAAAQQVPKSQSHNIDLLFIISTAGHAGDGEKTINFVSANPEDKIEGGFSKSVEVTDVDDALKFLHGEAPIQSLDGFDEKKLLRKIDWTVMPHLFVTYYLQYTDKTLVSYAAVMGIRTDNYIDTNQFSYLALAFYVTFLFFELPNGWMIQHFPVAKYLGINVILWGICVTLNCVVKNYASLLVLRVLLGVFESVVAPSLILIVGMWYKKKFTAEQPLRIGIWYLGVSAGPFISGLCSYGLLFYTGKQFHSWQVLFLVFGVITVFIGVIIVLILPNNPMHDKFLTHEERVFAIERIRLNQTGIENKKYKPRQALDAAKELQIWLLALMVCSSNVPNAAGGSFGSIIIENFGYTEKQTLLLGLPGCGLSALATWGFSKLAGKFNMRCIMCIGTLIPAILGGALMAYLPADNKAGLLAGNYLTYISGPSLLLQYALVVANVAGHTEKTTMNPILLMSFCLGNILGPLTFRDQDAPQYIPAKIAIFATNAASIAFTLILMGYYKWENTRRDRLMQGLRHTENVEFMDLTNRENMEFRASWFLICLAFTHFDGIFANGVIGGPQTT